MLFNQTAALENVKRGFLMSPHVTVTPADGILSHQSILGMHRLGRFLLMIEQLELSRIDPATLQRVWAFPLLSKRIINSPATVVAEQSVFRTRKSSAIYSGAVFHPLPTSLMLILSHLISFFDDKLPSA
jgi:hypothetical protein